MPLDFFANSTNSGIQVESCKIPVVLSPDINCSPACALEWQPYEWNTITGLTQPSTTEIMLAEVGIYIFIGRISVLSPSSQKLQARILAYLNGVPDSEESFTGILVATDYNSSVHFAPAMINVPNSIIEVYSEKSGTSGVLEMTSGSLTILRLSNKV
jgi:hypothetical protein